MWPATCRGRGGSRGRGPGVLRVFLPAGLALALVVLGADAGEGTTPSQQQPCPDAVSIVLAGRRELRDGSLETEDGLVFPANTYYVTDTDIRGCPCLVATCFFKCCPWGKMLRKQERDCQDSNRGKTVCVDLAPPERCLPAEDDPAGRSEVAAVAGNGTAACETPSFTLDIYSASDLSLNGTEAQARLLQSGVVHPRDWIVVEGKPTSDKMFRLEPSEPSDRFFLLDNGSLWVPGLLSEPYHPEQYCMEVIADDGKVSPIVVFHRGGAPVLAEEEEQEIFYTLYRAGLLISIPFLVATFYVYASISELRNLHGKSLLCHVGSMILAYSVLVMVQSKLGREDDRVCVLLGFLLQFSFLASFFWLNIMCFDIWWTFSGFGGVKAGAPSWSSEREHRRFLAYSVYAWGLPLVILLVTVVAQVLDDALPDSFIRPSLGQCSSCFFENEARYAYFVGPVGFLLLCNVFLFVHTTYRIVRLRKETRALKGVESQRHSDDRQRYNVYLRLFVIMGVNWTAEVLSGFFPKLEYVWIIPDVTNSLQGISIFMMFVGTGRVRRLVVERLLHRQSPAVNSNASTKTTQATGNAAPTRSRASVCPNSATDEDQVGHDALEHAAGRGVGYAAGHTSMPDLVAGVPVTLPTPSSEAV